MSGYSAANPHYAPDDFSEDRERLERCEAEAGRWFAALTKPQAATYNATIAGLRGLAGPRYDRARVEAQAEWTRSTADARRIYELALADLMASGEISEATSYAYDEDGTTRGASYVHRWEPLFPASTMPPAMRGTP